MTSFNEVQNEVAPNLSHNSKIHWLINNQSKFCTLPWINLNTNTNGNLKLCCSIQENTFILNDDETPFNFGYDNIEDIWNSSYMKLVRNNTKTNVNVLECEECYSIEKFSGHSPRIGQNKLWGDKLYTDNSLSTALNTVFEKDNSNNHLTQLPVSLELRLGNQCNLQCITCWGMSSSLLHQERSEYLDKNYIDSDSLSWLKHKWEKDRINVESTDVRNWFETDIFYNNFKKIATNLRRLSTTGGEPTLIKANYKMFDMLLDANNTTCKIEFTSNMTSWNHSFYSKLEKFENVEIQMSIDGIGKVGEYIRYPTDFAKVRENIDKVVELSSTRPGWTINCYTVLQALNFKQVMPIWSVLYMLSLKYNKNIGWWPITLVHPNHLALHAIPYDIRENFIKQVTTQSKNFRISYEGQPNRFVISSHTFDTYKNAVLNSPYDETFNSQLKSFIEFNDKHRKLNGVELFKDIL